MRSERIALIDIDTQIYEAAFIAEETFYRVFNGRREIEQFDYKKEAQEFIDKHKDKDKLRAERDMELRPLSHAINAAKIAINALLRDLDEMRYSEYKAYMTGDNVFRYNIATIRPYKEGRPPKPVYYQEVKDYIRNKYHVTVTDKVEADDAVSIMATKLGDNSIIVSQDKDLNTVPGWHYNPKKKHKYYLSEEEAELFFWYQMLVGDSSDAITGCPGVGKVAARDILLSCDTLSCVHKAVWKAYEEAYPDLKFPEVQAIVKENQNLLWMLRKLELDDNGEVKLVW